MGFILIFVGVALIIYSVIFFIKGIRSTTTAYYENFVNAIEFPFAVFDANKLYSISFVGARFMSLNGKYDIKILGDTGVGFKPEKYPMISHFRYRGRISIEAFYFRCNPGKYSLSINNVQNLNIQGSRLISRELLEGPFEMNEVGLLVRESFSFRTKIIIRIAFIVGLLLFNFGMVFIVKG